MDTIVGKFHVDFVCFHVHDVVRRIIFSYTFFVRAHDIVVVWNSGIKLDILRQTQYIFFIRRVECLDDFRCRCLGKWFCMIAVFAHVEHVKHVFAIRFDVHHIFTELTELHCIYNILINLLINFYVKCFFNSINLFRRQNRMNKCITLIIMQPVLNVYIIHWEELGLRKQNIDKFISLSKNQTTFDVRVTIVNKHDPGSINEENVKNLVSFNKPTEKEDQSFAQYIRPLGVRNISNCLNHFSAIQNISAGSEDETHIILEDDIMFSDVFFTQLRSVVETKNTEKWNVMFLGQPKDNTDDSTSLENLEIYELNKTVPIMSCDSYIISPSDAKQMILSFFPIRLETHIQLSSVMLKCSMKSVKCFPNLTGDGSKVGTFPSSINVNNMLLYNSFYKQLYSQIENFTEINLPMISKMILENEYKESPDFMHLEALFYMKQNNIDKCLDIFREANKKYIIGKSLINNTSVFFKNYISTFRQLQKTQ
jgi:GR25 family glycosyltransferase involved in LPS biosynthesis